MLLRSLAREVAEDDKTWNCAACRHTVTVPREVANGWHCVFGRLTTGCDHKAMRTHHDNDNARRSITLTILQRPLTAIPPRVATATSDDHGYHDEMTHEDRLSGRLCVDIRKTSVNSLTLKNGPWEDNILPDFEVSVSENVRRSLSSFPPPTPPSINVGSQYIPKTTPARMDKILPDSTLNREVTGGSP